MAFFNYGTSDIYYEEDGGGDPVLLIPGFTQSIEDLSPVREELTKRYRVIAADGPGSGKSGPQPRDYPLTYYHDDADAFLALLGELDAKPAHLVGFSDGGEYDLVMAEKDPTAVRSIAAWGAAGKIAAAPPMLEAFASVIDNPIPPLKEYSEHLKAIYGEDRARATIASFIKAVHGMLDAGGDISWAQAGYISCPTLLISGEMDFVAPKEAAAELAALIPNATFIEVEGAGHDIQRSHGDWLANTIVDFLAKA